MAAQKSVVPSTNALKTVVVIMVPKGGEGKSHLADVGLCISTFSGISTVLGTNDGTNRALKALNPDQPIASFGWSADHTRGRNIVLKAAQSDVCIFDIGAISDADDDRIFRFLQGVKEAADDLNARVVILTPSATNKGGNVKTSKITVDVLWTMEFYVHLVLNDRDGSGNFGDLSVLPKDLPISYLPHLAPGLNCYRNDEERSLHSIITQPAPGYEQASARLKDYVLSAAEGAWARDVFWWDGALDRLPERQKLPGLRKSLKTKDDVTNASLDLNAKYHDAIRRFKCVDRSSPEFLSYAEELQDILRRIE